MVQSKLKAGENKIFFESDGKKLAAFLYIPKDYNEGEKLPAFPVIRPTSGVKEQTAGLYAKKLSEKGFVTIAFDPKGFGESEGRPQVEDPNSIMSDAKNAITYLQSLPQVDPNKIYSVGICAGAGYCFVGSTEDERVKKIGMISPSITNSIEYPAANGGKLVLQVMFAAMKPFIWFFGLFGINFYLPLAPLTQFQKKRMPMMPHQFKALQYYDVGQEGNVPNWKNKLNLYKGETAAIYFNPFEYLSKNKNKKLFFAYADDGQWPEKLQEFYEKVEVKDKEIMIRENANHFDLYNKPEHVDPIVDKLANYFKA